MSTTTANAKRGRPRKVRPEPGTLVAPGMSRRDCASALGLSRNELSRWMVMAEAPADAVEEYFAECRDNNRIPKARDIELLARRQAGKACPVVVRSCPHCGKPLRIGDQ
jgi:hypothetical protein